MRLFKEDSRLRNRIDFRIHKKIYSVFNMALDGGEVTQEVNASIDIPIRNQTNPLLDALDAYERTFPDKRKSR